MAIRKRSPFPPDSTVECIESFVAQHPRDHTDVTVCRQGTTWRSDDDVVKRHAQWFVPLGEGQRTTRWQVPRLDPN